MPKLKSTFRKTARVGGSSTKVLANQGLLNRKTIQKAVKITALRRSIRKSTGHAVNPKTTNVKALQRAVRMMKNP